jgi:hypothetical protein
MAPITPMSLIQRAQESNASIEQMQQLFELQIRYEENEARKAYHRAVAAFKSESITIVKDKAVGYTNKDGSFTGYKHASIGNVVQTLIPAMANHGLSHCWDVHQDSGQITVTCKLSHELGHSTSVSMSAGKDDSGKKNMIQQVASTVTYLQRYTFLSITGFATRDQEDDDGRGGKDPVKEPAKDPAPATFDEKFQKWQQLILSRKKTANELIAFLASKNVKLTDDQKSALIEIERGME